MTKTPDNKHLLYRTVLLRVLSSSVRPSYEDSLLLDDLFGAGRPAYGRITGITSDENLIYCKCESHSRDGHEEYNYTLPVSILHTDQDPVEMAALHNLSVEISRAQAALSKAQKKKKEAEEEVARLTGQTTLADRALIEAIANLSAYKLREDSKKDT